MTPFVRLFFSSVAIDLKFSAAPISAFLKVKARKKRLRLFLASRSRRSTSDNIVVSRDSRFDFIQEKFNRCEFNFAFFTSSDV
jgi:hypothetical protein